MKWIHSALDLDRVIYIETRISLTVLREMFKEMGLREEERKITKAIRTSDRRKAQQSGDVGQWIEGAFNFAAFEITTGYGYNYGRPLWILAALIPIFAVPYAVAISGRTRGQGGIWVVWPADPAMTSRASQESTRLTVGAMPGGSARANAVHRVAWVVGFSLYFSIVSADEEDSTT